MSLPKVTVYTGNLKVGGGVQVAGSFLDEFAAMLKEPTLQAAWMSSTRIVVSRAVWAQLSPESCATLNDMRMSPAQHMREPSDVEFVIFGPRYVPSRARRTLMGFADGTLLHPHVAGVPQPSALTRLKRAVRTPLAWRAFDRADRLVVETAVVKGDIVRQRHRTPGTVAVVGNTVSARFAAGDGKVQVPREPDQFLFAYVSRPYPHKNFSFLAPFVRRLDELGVSSKVVVTLTPEEWDALSKQDREALVNVGPVTIDEARSVYEQCDAAVFPSLLEAFSASPLEAMSVPRPLYASDRDFVRAICDSVPHYFDPLDPNAAAESFVANRSAHDHGRLGRGLALVAGLPNARQRAVEYLGLIDALLESPDEL